MPRTRGSRWLPDDVRSRRVRLNAPCLRRRCPCRRPSARPPTRTAGTRRRTRSAAGSRSRVTAGHGPSFRVRRRVRRSRRRRDRHATVTRYVQPSSNGGLRGARRDRPAAHTARSVRVLRECRTLRHTQTLQSNGSFSNPNHATAVLTINFLIFFFFFCGGREGIRCDSRVNKNEKYKGFLLIETVSGHVPDTVITVLNSWKRWSWDCPSFIFVRRVL